MAIRRMISRDPAEIREFRTRMTTVGKIRLGVYETPEGRRGRPVKIDTFRFTADNEELIRAVAEEYGGEAQQWTPQGSKTPQWEVITDARAVEVYVVNGQNIDPVYEAWAGGRTCVRRCDGEWNQITQEPCLCNGPNRPQDARELCKPTTRVQLMLQRIQGLGSWLLESHGENFAIEVSTFREFVATAPMPVPAMLRLRKETRRQWNFDKKKFDTLEFYVPWLDVSAVNARTIAIGGDALTQALSAAGAPSAIGGSPQLAIEARPVSAPVPPQAPAVFDIEAMRPRILADIEACTTVEALEAIKQKLISRGANDQRVKEAWASKRAAVVAADELPTGRPYRVLVTGSRTWTDTETLDTQLSIALMAHRGRMVLVSGACPQGADKLAEEWAAKNGVPVERFPANWDELGKSAGFKRNQLMVDTRPDIVLSFNRSGSKGTEHCTAAAEAAGLKVLRFTDDTPVERKAPERQPQGIPLKEYRVGDDGIVDTAREMFADVPEQYNEAIQRGATPDEIIEAGGPLHWLAGDDQSRAAEAAERNAHREAMPVDEDGCYTLPDGSCVSPGPCIHTPVEGVVETTGPVLPDIPDGDYDTDEVYASLMTGASKQTPPLTTAEVNALILRHFPANNVEFIGGYELARLRAGLKSGAVAWR